MQQAVQQDGGIADDHRPGAAAVRMGVIAQQRHIKLPFRVALFTGQGLVGARQRLDIGLAAGQQRVHQGRATRHFIKRAGAGQAQAGLPAANQGSGRFCHVHVGGEEERVVNIGAQVGALRDDDAALACKAHQAVQRVEIGQAVRVGIVAGNQHVAAGFGEGVQAFQLAGQQVLLRGKNHQQIIRAQAVPAEQVDPGYLKMVAAQVVLHVGGIRFTQLAVPA